jgi:hypothetical protein
MWERDAATHTGLARAFELSNTPDSARAHTARAIAIDSLDPRALELSRRLGMRVVTVPK